MHDSFYTTGTSVVHDAFSVDDAGFRFDFETRHLVDVGRVVRSVTPGGVIPLEVDGHGQVSIGVLGRGQGVVLVVDLCGCPVLVPSEPDLAIGEECVLTIGQHFHQHGVVVLEGAGAREGGRVTGGDFETIGHAALIHLDGSGGIDDQGHGHLGHVGVVVTGRVVVGIATHHHEGEGQRHQEGEEIAGHDDTPWLPRHSRKSGGIC